MAGIDWDNVLPEDLTIKWEKWVSELPNLSQMAIPRCLAWPTQGRLIYISSPMLQKMPLHLMPIWYVSKQTALGHHTLLPQIVMCPVKTLRIPHLELMGAVLSSHLAQSILKVMTRPTQKMCGSG
ncbi:hypothetical protein OS493_001594, partial [Desmophyllum pertusum]